jgi:hypothetical protein
MGSSGEIETLPQKRGEPQSLIPSKGDKGPSNDRANVETQYSGLRPGCAGC